MKKTKKKEADEEEENLRHTIPWGCLSLHLAHTGSDFLQSVYFSQSNEGHWHNHL